MYWCFDVLGWLFDAIRWAVAIDMTVLHSQGNFKTWCHSYKVVFCDIVNLEWFSLLRAAIITQYLAMMGTRTL
jgi:hypothetical protein